MSQAGLEMHVGQSYCKMKGWVVQPLAREQMVRISVAASH